MDETGVYICDSCGEEVQVSLDPSGGNPQHYVEDCPICCVPNLLRVSWETDGAARIDATRE